MDDTTKNVSQAESTARLPPKFGAKVWRTVWHSPSFQERALRLLKPEETNDMLMHCAVGIAGEAGELLDCVKKHWKYGKDFDRNNAVEECGDLLFYSYAMYGLLDTEVPRVEMFSLVATELLDPITAKRMMSLSTSIFVDSATILREYDLSYNFDWRGPPPIKLIETKLRHVVSTTFQFMHEVGITPEEVDRGNLEKLEKKRYPKGYTDSAAVDRADKA